jgi:hypothetical protein
LSLALSALAIHRINFNSVKDSYQADIKNVDERLVSVLEKDSRLNRVGSSYLLNYVQAQNGNIFYMYYSDAMLEQQPSIRGAFPKSEYGIAVSQNFLDMTGLNVDVGGIITLSSGENINGDFTVTDILDNSQLQGNTAYAFFSKAYIAQHPSDSGMGYNAYLWLDSAQSLSAAETQRLLAQICEDHGIDSERINFNEAILAI